MAKHLTSCVRRYSAGRMQDSSINTTVLDPIARILFVNRLNAVCDEMGALLQRAAFSPNIRDRLDFSCAVFDARGDLCAQAAHIPVHLGSMAYAMRDIVAAQAWREGEMCVLNDPYLGGTHLPDVTVIAPVFVEGVLVAFVANRAHHADIGSDTPGSMPVSRTLEEEGLVIAPTVLSADPVARARVLDAICAKLRNPQAARGDFQAQISSNGVAMQRVQALANELGSDAFAAALVAVNDYAEALARSALQDLPQGTWTFCDVLDDDGLGQLDIPIEVQITHRNAVISVDFTGTHAQVAGNVNCPLSVAAAGVYYVFRCLMPDYTPAAAGAFRSIQVYAPEGCLLNAKRPAAVAAGNVETSSRVVDVVIGALAQAIPERMAAASQGSMNNLAMGAAATAMSAGWDYYETMGGGMGASSRGPGLSARQTHMTNTRNTPVEVLELLAPIRVEELAVRRGSGGAGRFLGGEGVRRRYRFLDDAHATLLTERRRHAPWGFAEGAAGAVGRNVLDEQVLPSKISLPIRAGQVLSIETPGGGGWGRPASGSTSPSNKD